MEELLKNIMGNPAAMEQIMGLVQSFKETDSKSDEQQIKPKDKLPFGLDNPEVLLKLGNAFGKMVNDDDPRINLLLAIKPYLNVKRIQNVDRAMQMIKLSKMSSVFEELKIL